MYFLTFTPSPPRNSRGGDVFYHLCLLEQWGDALWVKAGNAATDGCYQELLLGMLTPLFSEKLCQLMSSHHGDEAKDEATEEIEHHVEILLILHQR